MTPGLRQRREATYVTYLSTIRLEAYPDFPWSEAQHGRAARYDRAGGHGRAHGRALSTALPATNGASIDRRHGHRPAGGHGRSAFRALLLSGRLSERPSGHEARTAFFQRPLYDRLSVCHPDSILVGGAVRRGLFHLLVGHFVTGHHGPARQGRAEEQTHHGRIGVGAGPAGAQDAGAGRRRGVHRGLGRRAGRARGVHPGAGARLGRLRGATTADHGRLEGYQGCRGQSAAAVARDACQSAKSALVGYPHSLLRAHSGRFRGHLGHALRAASRLGTHVRLAVRHRKHHRGAGVCPRGVHGRPLRQEAFRADHFRVLQLLPDGAAAFAVAWTPGGGLCAPRAQGIRRADPQGADYGSGTGGAQSGDFRAVLPRSRRARRFCGFRWCAAVARVARTEPEGCLRLRRDRHPLVRVART